MELQASVPTSYDLTPSYFTEQIFQPGKDTAWRQTQVNRVLSSFEEAKKEMSEGGIILLYNYLEDGRWIDDGECPSYHLIYRRFMGREGNDNEPPTLFYPEFFVIQAIFGVGIGNILITVKRMYQMMSEHWGVDITPGKHFYPRLDDSAQEYLLLLGNYQAQVSSNKIDTTPQGTQGDLQLQALQRQNVDLQQQVEEQGRNQQLLENELQHALRQLESCHLYANRLEDTVVYLQDCVDQHRRTPIGVQELNE